MIWIYFTGHIIGGGNEFLSWPMRRRRFKKDLIQMITPDGWVNCQPELLWTT